MERGNRHSQAAAAASARVRENLNDRYGEIFSVTDGTELRQVVAAARNIRVMRLLI
jgi:hypothetical protein